MDIDPEAVKWLQVIVEHKCTVCEWKVHDLHQLCTVCTQLSLMS